MLALLNGVIESFVFANGRGLLLGNLTSQLFSNVYLDQLDQFAKRFLRLKYYLRYADDIIVLSADKAILLSAPKKLGNFLAKELSLCLNYKKTHFKLWQNGVDVLGYISYPTKTILRASTAARMFNRLQNCAKSEIDIRINDLFSKIKFERRI